MDFLVGMLKESEYQLRKSLFCRNRCIELLEDPSEPAAGVCCTYVDEEAKNYISDGCYNCQRKYFNHQFNIWTEVHKQNLGKQNIIDYSFNAPLLLQLLIIIIFLLAAIERHQRIFPDALPVKPDPTEELPALSNQKIEADVKQEPVDNELPTPMPSQEDMKTEPMTDEDMPGLANDAVDADDVQSGVNVGASQYGYNDASVSAGFDMEWYDVHEDMLAVDMYTMIRLWNDRPGNQLANPFN